MLLIREVFFCKPGQVRPMVEKFKAMNAVMERLNLGKSRIMTDLARDLFDRSLDGCLVGQHVRASTLVLIEGKHEISGTSRSDGTAVPLPRRPAYLTYAGFSRSIRTRSVRVNIPGRF